VARNNWMMSILMFDLLVLPSSHKTLLGFSWILSDSIGNLTVSEVQSSETAHLLLN